MKNKNPIILRSDEKIGHLDADSDEDFLYVCFFDHPAFARANDIDAPETILSGRTGTGKTAIIKKTLQYQKRAVQISLHDVTLDYIGNSDIMSFLISIDADLDIIFQYLWKHVLCIEIIRMYFKVENEKDSIRVFDQIFNIVSNNNSRKRASEYLTEWNKKFWISMDENVREIAEKIEDKVSAEFGADMISKARANAGFGRTLSTEKKQSLQTRARSIIDTKLLSDLSKVLESINEIIDDKSKNDYFIFIDNFDEPWASDRIKYKLIAALINTLPKFRKIRKLRVIVSIRDDVLERTLFENKSPGFQMDKFDDMQLRIKWSEKQLKTLIDKRINYLFKKKYTKENVHFEDIFPDKVDRKNTFRYMVERSFLRPRDLIDFVNRCLHQAEGKSSISLTNIREAERDYSITRLRAVKDEWRSVYPSIDTLLEGLKGVRPYIGAEEFSDSANFKAIFESLFDQRPVSFDPLVSYVQNNISYFGNDNMTIAPEIISALYRIGVIGIKTNSDDILRFSHVNGTEIGTNTINKACRIGIHKMFHIALGVSGGKTR